MFCLLIFIVHLFHDYGNSLSLICLTLWFCFSYMYLFILFFLFLFLSLFLPLCTWGTFIFLTSGCNLWLLMTLNLLLMARGHPRSNAAFMYIFPSAVLRMGINSHRTPSFAHVTRVWTVST